MGQNIELEFDYEIEKDNDTIAYNVVWRGSFEWDNNYGADADGNRGVCASWVEDVEFEVSDEYGETITNELKTQKPELYALIEMATDKEVEDFDPEGYFSE